MSRLRVAAFVLVSGLLEPSPASTQSGKDADLATTVQRLLEQREYEASENDVGLQAPNRAHNLRSYFEPTGVRVLDRTEVGNEELMALRISGLGRSEALAKVPPGTVSSAGARAEIQRPGLTEWYVNSKAGLEQGFTVERRPAGLGEVVIELEVEHARGQLVGDRVLFETPSGRRLEYAKLVVFDPLIASTWDGIVYNDFGQFDARLGVSVAGAGDVNGDAYADVIVGAHLYDAGESDEGIAAVFHGGPSGISHIIPSEGICVPG